MIYVDRVVIVGSPIFGQVHRTLDPPRPWPNKLLARYGRKGVDHSRRLHVGGEAQFFGVRPASLIDGLQYRSFLIRLSSSRGFWNFDKFSRLHVVDVAVNWNVSIPAGASLYRYFRLEIERPDVPHVKAWYQRLQERPAYRDSDDPV